MDSLTADQRRECGTLEVYIDPCTPTPNPPNRYGTGLVTLGPISPMMLHETYHTLQDYYLTLQRTHPRTYRNKYHAQDLIEAHKKILQQADVKKTVDTIYDYFHQREMRHKYDVLKFTEPYHLPILHRMLDELLGVVRVFEKVREYLKKDREFFEKEDAKDRQRTADIYFGCKMGASTFNGVKIYH